jgi:dTDP-4-amino-4,6-dideoxygalactose transaminase
MLDIPLFRPYLDEDELNEVKNVLDSKWLAQGSKVKELESLISKKLGIKHVIVCSSCTTALHLALLGVGIKSGDDVLVADYTFPATGHAVMHCQARPIFVDVDPRTYNLNIQDGMNKMTRKVKAIIPVHTFGQAAEMDDIVEFAKSNNLYIIEDAACAFGAKYKGSMLGTIGDVGCFSFHATKGMTTGEGGCVVTNNDEVAKKIRSLFTFGSEKHASWEREKNKSFLIPIFMTAGFNYKMSDIAAACGVAQIRKLDKIIERKRKLAKYWDNKLSDMSYIIAPYVEPYNYHNYQGYCTLVDACINRNNVIQSLKDRGIGSQIGTYCSFIQPAYGSHYECPTSLDIYNRALRLPLYYDLTERDIDITTYELEKICIKEA